MLLLSVYFLLTAEVRSGQVECLTALWIGRWRIFPSGSFLQQTLFEGLTLKQLLPFNDLSRLFLGTLLILDKCILIRSGLLPGFVKNLHL